MACAWDSKHFILVHKGSRGWEVGCYATMRDLVRGRRMHRACT